MQTKRVYGRLARLERTAIEDGLSKRLSIRSIANKLGRSPSIIANEIKTNRTILKGAQRGSVAGEAPDSACFKLHRSPGVCNVCKYHHHPCSHNLKIEYLAARADRLAVERRSETRMGVD